MNPKVRSKMRSKSGLSKFLLLLSVLPLPIHAGEGTVLYRLEKGSTLLDDCPVCLRPPIEWPLEGTFILTLENIGDVTDWYRVNAIDFRTTGQQEYLVSGSGSYLTRLGEGGLVDTQSMSLEVEINGEAGITLESGEVKADVALPDFDIQVEEQTSSLVRVFKLHIVASPVEAVAYEVLPGSVFVDDCQDCDRLIVPRPLTGGFLLSKIDEAPALRNLPALRHRVPERRGRHRITGWGTYAIGGEVALLQGMDLELAVSVEGSTRSPVVLTSGGNVGMMGRQFPEIEIQVDEKDPSDINHIYKVHLVARPKAVSSSPFRRGDVNGDGSVDLADAVKVLTWLFLGDAPPDCLDAANADHTRARSVSLMRSTCSRTSSSEALRLRPPVRSSAGLRSIRASAASPTVATESSGDSRQRFRLNLDSHFGPIRTSVGRGRSASAPREHEARTSLLPGLARAPSSESHDLLTRSSSACPPRLQFRSLL
jgi:hypothetical protein